ncbi:hypothetical protein [Amycolatopsis sp. NPDC058986]|uniref:hypothetical protein n=1 Tax=unclassified Amycolatopsis TaxID=2618356 RepID=UPI00367119FD
MTSEGVTMQEEFEQDLRVRSDRAPFSQCMDYAAAILAQFLHTSDQSRHADGSGRPVEVGRDVLTLLGLALYQSGLDLYARDDDGPPRGTMEVYDIRLADAIAVLDDRARAWKLLECSPGHLDWPAGRIREPWTSFAAALRTEGPSSPRWEPIRQQALSAITAARNSVITRLGHLVHLVHHWNTFDWYDTSGDYNLNSHDRDGGDR